MGMLAFSYVEMLAFSYASNREKGAAAMERDTLRRHYESLSCEGRFESRCHMELPERSLVGARIVNVGCRRGKGTYKLSERVGADGFVVGVDWNEGFVEAARSGVPEAIERSGLSRCNMSFHVGFPEDLVAAGIEEGWADFVYLNSSLFLFASPTRALRECYRALVPGGVLLAEVPVAEPNGEGRTGDTDCAADANRAAVIKAARALPNAVQAAPTFEELLGWLAEAGFSEPTVRSERPLSPDEGSTPDRPAATVPGDDASYRLLSIEASK